MALQRHCAQGAPAGWGTRVVGAHASSHPWEDWAETRAHDLHLTDTQDTALSFGPDGERVELSDERIAADALDVPDEDFVRPVNGWMELTGVLSERSRSMGMADSYPFVMSVPVQRKLHFVHRIVPA